MSWTYSKSCTTLELHLHISRLGNNSSNKMQWNNTDTLVIVNSFNQFLNSPCRSSTTTAYQLFRSERLTKFGQWSSVRITPRDLCHTKFNRSCWCSFEQFIEELKQLQSFTAINMEQLLPKNLLESRWKKVMYWIQLKAYLSIYPFNTPMPSFTPPLCVLIRCCGFYCFTSLLETICKDLTKLLEVWK